MDFIVGGRGGTAEQTSFFMAVVFFQVCYFFSVFYGIWGGICTGLFTQASINDIGQGNGLFFGDTKLFLMQLASIGITIVVAVVGTLICYALTKLVSGGNIRVDARTERAGLDRAEHGEAAYPSFTGLD